MRSPVYPKVLGKADRGMEETERIDETDTIVLDFQEFTAVPELLDQTVVVTVLMNHKIPVISSEIMSEHIDLSGVILC